MLRPKGPETKTQGPVFPSQLTLRLFTHFFEGGGSEKNGSIQAQKSTLILNSFIGGGKKTVPRGHSAPFG